MAETYSGVLAYVAWGEESTYGTAATTIDQWELMRNVNARLGHNSIPVKGLGARYTQAIKPGPTDGAFSAEMVLQDMRMLTAIGGMADTKTGSGDITHTIVPATTIDSGTIELGHNGTADVIYKLTGLMINSWTLNLTLNDVATVSLDCIYQEIDDSDTTAQTPSFKTTDPFALAEIQAKVGDSAVAEVQSGSLTYNNNLVPIRGLGSADLTDIMPGPLDVTWSMNLNMRDITFHEYIEDNTEIDFEFVLTESATRNITFTMNNSVIDGWSEPADVGGGVVNVTIDGIARYDSAEGVAANKNIIQIIEDNAIDVDYDA